MIHSTETITRRRFTVDEYHRMWDADLFSGDKRFELIRGDILEMPNGRPQHSSRVNRLTHLFTRRLGDSIIVSVQNPFTIDTYSEPVPDVSMMFVVPFGSSNVQNPTSPSVTRSVVMSTGTSSGTSAGASTSPPGGG